MKKRQIHYQAYNPKKRKLLLSILFFSILLVVAIVALYFSLQPREIQLSPDEQTIDIDTAESLLKAIGPECIRVLYKKIDSCEDAQGNKYSFFSLMPVIEFIGEENLAELKDDVLAIQPQPIETPTPAPTTQPTATQTATPASTATPKPSATATQSLSPTTSSPSPSASVR